MKIGKKCISLCLAAAMMVTVTTGCGKKDTGSGEDAFVIGGLGPLTGPAASYGISVKQGAEVAVEEINAAGGVNGQKLELKFMDDEASEETAVTAYNTLMDEGIDALMGTVTSGACLAIVDLTKEDGILQITPSGSAKGCTEYDNAFRLCFTDPLQGEKMAEFAVNELGKTKIAVLYNNADEYSQGVNDAFVAKVKELGGTIVSEQSFKTDDIDFSAQLTSIKSTDAEIIFVPAYYGDAAYITTQAADLGMELPFIGSDGWDGVLQQVTNKDVVEGAIFLSPFLATDPSAADFVSTYNEKYGTTPDQFAADGYDTIYVIKAAIEKAGATDSESLIAAMTEIEVDGLTGKVSFTADGEPNKDAIFVEIKNGEYTAR
ncbi:ABC transporter substrate-binding protein [Anaeromicropila populeti]|uniref:Branched-chain amino acid transport system substrate-binding protein n=1 Tax=Anaeromicropila populeti TaxID=37658 RepID=A0A1I6HL09_9FIRM|nr:ABC transporter substrate-binding protein [Anaeromicropila populeti]SFR54980.1 branched-chain amino acid transport system substrate-binding protein [Anaeromicropila populeti]